MAEETRHDCRDCDDRDSNFWNGFKGNGICSYCHGEGEVLNPFRTTYDPCPKCQLSCKCQSCDGEGYIYSYEEDPSSSYDDSSRKEEYTNTKSYSDSSDYSNEYSSRYSGGSGEYDSNSTYSGSGGSSGGGGGTNIGESILGIIVFVVFAAIIFAAYEQGCGTKRTPTNNYNSHPSQENNSYTSEPSLPPPENQPENKPVENVQAPPSSLPDDAANGEEPVQNDAKEIPIPSKSNDEERASRAQEVWAEHQRERNNNTGTSQTETSETGNNAEQKGYSDYAQGRTRDASYIFDQSGTVSLTLSTSAVVKSGVTLTITSGTYIMGSLTLEPGSKVTNYGRILNDVYTNGASFTNNGTVNGRIVR